MYMSNLEKHGHLVNPDEYSTEYLHNDLYEIDTNRVVSELCYLCMSYSVCISYSVFMSYNVFMSCCVYIILYLFLLSGLGEAIHKC